MKKKREIRWREYGGGGEGEGRNDGGEEGKR
jgi:hypothetical protein